MEIESYQSQSINIISKLQIIWNRNIRAIIPFAGLILIIVIFYIITSGKILNVRNLKLILEQSIVLIIASIGVTFVMSMGSIDFSQGSILAICAFFGAMLSKQSPILGFFASIALGIMIGAVNGYLVSLKIPSFIVTISTMFIFRGLTSYLTKDCCLTLPMKMAVLDNINFKLIILGLIVLLGFYFFEFSKLGKHCKAIGAAEKAAIFSGVDVKKVKIIAFIIAGCLAGLCGMLSLIRTRIASPFTGNNFEIEVFMALVFGGMPINGGMKSRIRCGILGSLMLAFLANGLVLMGISANVLQLIKGFVFLIAVYISIERRGIAVIK